MKRIYVAVVGAVLVVGFLFAGYMGLHNRGGNIQDAETAGPVYAYADVEHIMMSHPEYSKYHHLELQYNAMIAQYQFEQWNYSQKAAAQNQVFQTLGGNAVLMSAALDQELHARVALKENELNMGLQKKYQELLKTKKELQPQRFKGNELKIINLKLKLGTLSLSAEERAAANAQLTSLLKGNDAETETSLTEAEITSAMAPYKAQAQQEMAVYTEQVKQELKGRQQESYNLFQQHMNSMDNRPEPAIWNKEWQDKLAAKEKEINEVKDNIMADVREKAAAVAQEQGITMIFSDYLGTGSAQDVTDDIIAKLA